MKHIVTPRLLMRPFSERDLGDLSTLYSNSEAMDHIPPFRPLDTEETKASLERMIRNFEASGYGEFAVIERKEKRFIGKCGLQVLENTNLIELDFLFLPQYWHKGYATEGSMAILRSAFNEWGLERIVGVVRESNKASVRVLEKLGMSSEGHADHFNTEMILYSLEKPKITSDDSIFRSTYQNNRRLQVC